METIEMVKPINAVTFFFFFISNKNPMPIGTEFLIKNNGKRITLIECDGYPKGKFVYESGEAFDIAQNIECEFIQIPKQKENTASVYNEELWNEVDARVYGKKDKNGNYIPFEIENEKTPLILKTFVAPQKREKFHDFVYFDVTKIIDSLLNNNGEYSPANSDKIREIIKYLDNNYYPVFTKEKLYLLFANCSFKNTKYNNIVRVIQDGEDIGYLVGESGKYMFSPKNKSFGDEYSHEDVQSTGFYYTAESYLDIALATIERNHEMFVGRYNTNPNKNSEDDGYHADATIKSLLAFSCECYIKSLLLNGIKRIDELKGLGHGLVVLYTSLSDELMAKIFDYMEQNGYNLSNPLYKSEYETNDLTDKFMMDLTRDNDAFSELRYPAEYDEEENKDKNTDYSFLYRFALALRHCSMEEHRVASPFTNSIENKISKK